jgi:hypothetical protein
MTAPRFSPKWHVALTATGIIALTATVSAKVPDAEAIKLTSKYGCQACLVRLKPVPPQTAFAFGDLITFPLYAAALALLKPRDANRC